MLHEFSHCISYYRSSSSLISLFVHAKHITCYLKTMPSDQDFPFLSRTAPAALFIIEWKSRGFSLTRSRLRRFETVFSSMRIPKTTSATTRRAFSSGRTSKILPGTLDSVRSVMEGHTRLSDERLLEVLNLRPATEEDITGTTRVFYMRNWTVPATTMDRLLGEWQDLREFPETEGWLNLAPAVDISAAVISPQMRPGIIAYLTEIAASMNSVLSFSPHFLCIRCLRRMNHQQTRPFYEVLVYNQPTKFYRDREGIG
ncbi:hypothetical protein BCR43DRAFT_495960 [Syncephalastrum racemosum]|uniref:Uncharacterized protein n=1 Tax=Syncephalastrum racemosum TaxID=13706 RepID=A0A1X2H6P8_SYNRA|nr:hypothetical protein BCR43DRAFT_495960 [Syncephalastrum racemosum]